MTLALTWLVTGCLVGSLAHVLTRSQRHFELAGDLALGLFGGITGGRGCRELGRTPVASNTNSSSRRSSRSGSVSPIAWRPSAAADRIDARNDYEVNLRAEMEIVAPHAKRDSTGEQEWVEFLCMQREQLDPLRRIEGAAAAAMNLALPHRLKICG